MSTACLSSGQRNGWREDCKDTLLLLKTEVTEHVMGAVTCRSLAKAGCGDGDCFRSGALIANGAKFRMHEQSFIPHAQPGVQPEGAQILAFTSRLGGAHTADVAAMRKSTPRLERSRGIWTVCNDPKARNYIMGPSTRRFGVVRLPHIPGVVALPHRWRAWPGAEGGAIASWSLSGDLFDEA